MKVFIRKGKTLVFIPFYKIFRYSTIYLFFCIFRKWNLKKDWKKFLEMVYLNVGENVEENLVDIFSISRENKSEFYYEMKPDVQIMDDYIETNNQEV